MAIPALIIVIPLLSMSAVDKRSVYPVIEAATIPEIFAPPRLPIMSNLAKNSSGERTTSSSQKHPGPPLARVKRGTRIPLARHVLGGTNHRAAGSNMALTANQITKEIHISCPVIAGNGAVAIYAVLRMLARKLWITRWAHATMSL